ncbi:VOC family protein [Actinophytocola sp.]|uniref:VOC family protein n=1 Tax=Actinophytocola sp. TaxID=1872138 RepID=UPI0039C88748
MTVADLAESRNFYTNILGLVVTEEDDSACYLRGLQEACHHSLILEQSRDGGTCRRIGFRGVLRRGPRRRLPLLPGS